MSQVQRPIPTRARPSSKNKQIDENALNVAQFPGQSSKPFQAVTKDTQQLKNKDSMSLGNAMVSGLKAGAKRVAMSDVGNISKVHAGESKNGKESLKEASKLTIATSSSRSKSSSNSGVSATTTNVTTTTTTSAILKSSRPRLPLGGKTTSTSSTSNIVATSYPPAIEVTDLSRPGQASTTVLQDRFVNGEDAMEEDEDIERVQKESGMQIDEEEDILPRHANSAFSQPKQSTSTKSSQQTNVEAGEDFDDFSSDYDRDDDEEEEEDDEDWMRMSDGEAKDQALILKSIQAKFEDEVDPYDTTMVSEYADEIFDYMSRLEVTTMPNPRYMDFQTEIEWSMRTTLIDWLLQVHLRYHMLPETLWIAVNIIDRFLSVRVVSLIKLQLVGVTAMFIAAKYEEILAPSVDEFVYMTENGYTKDEILKGERIVLQTLEFSVSSYCSPYSWVRRISKADDYDIQTRTLAKFLMEASLLDHRFLRARPSMIAAIAMYLATKMLGHEWNASFIFYSGFTEAQLLPASEFLVEQISGEAFESQYVYRKFSTKKFLKASTFARQWCLANPLQQSQESR